MGKGYEVGMGKTREEERESQQQDGGEGEADSFLGP